MLGSQVLGLTSIMHIGCLLISAWFLLINQCELSAAFFGLSTSFSQVGLWLGPLFTVLIIFKITNRHLSGAGL